MKDKERYMSSKERQEIVEERHKVIGDLTSI